MQVPFFMAPDKIITPEKTHEFPLPKAKIKHNFMTTPGFIYQIQGVRESLLKGNSHLFVQGTFFFPFFNALRSSIAFGNSPRRCHFANSSGLDSPSLCHHNISKN